MPFTRKNQDWSPVELAYWESELRPKLLREGAITPVAGPLRYSANSYLVAKRSGGYRHVINLRPIN